MTAPPVRALSRLHLLRRHRLRRKHKQTLLKHHDQPIKAINIHATTAATIAVTIALSAVAVQAFAAHGTREADSASATMMVRAGVRGQDLDHGMTGTEDIMTVDPAYVAHGTGAEAAAADSVLAAVTVLIGIQVQATALAVGRVTDAGMTGAEDFMTGAPASVDLGMTTAEVEWASAGNRILRIKPCIAGLYFWLLESIKVKEQNTLILETIAL